MHGIEQSEKVVKVVDVIVNRKKPPSLPVNKVSA